MALGREHRSLLLSLAERRPDLDSRVQDALRVLDDLEPESNLPDWTAVADRLGLLAARVEVPEELRSGLRPENLSDALAELLDWASTLRTGITSWMVGN